MKETATDLRRTADELRASGAYEAAGDVFTRAFYNHLGNSEYGEYIRNSSVGQGLYCLLGAALCYRLTGSKIHCENRCDQGILLVSDLREYITEEPALAGLLYECQGDFECIASTTASDCVSSQIDNPYCHAIEEYKEADHLDMWQSEPVFEWVYAFSVRVIDASSSTIDNLSVFHSSPSMRVEYKQRHFEEIIRTVIESGEWKYETTF